MAKGNGKLIAEDIPVTFNLSHVVATDYIRQAIQNTVAQAVEAAITESVGAAVQELVDKIGRDKIGKAIDATLAEGWESTNEYGERQHGKLTLKDRIGKILNHKDPYSSHRAWIDERIKGQVDAALNKDLKADIEAARNKFKSEVDAVLTATIREALAKNLGLKA